MTIPTFDEWLQGRSESTAGVGHDSTTFVDYLSAVLEAQGWSRMSSGQVDDVRGQQYVMLWGLDGYEVEVQVTVTRRPEDWTEVQEVDTPRDPSV